MVPTTPAPLFPPCLSAVVNILTLIFLLRFWPVPGGRSPLGGVEPITVQASIRFTKAVDALLLSAGGPCCIGCEV